MSNFKQSLGRWLSGKSLALGEIAKFGKWSLLRMASPARLLVTLVVIFGLATIPWMQRALAPWGWLWVTGVVTVAVTFIVVLLVSYLRLRWSEHSEELGHQFANRLIDIDRRFSIRSGEIDRQLAERQVDQSQLGARIEAQIIALGGRLEGLVNERVESARRESIKQLQGSHALVLDRVANEISNSHVLIDQVAAAQADAAAAATDLEARIRSRDAQAKVNLEELAREQKTIASALDDIGTQLRKDVEDSRGSIERTVDEISHRLAATAALVEDRLAILAGQRDVDADMIAILEARLARETNRAHERMEDFAAGQSQTLQDLGRLQARLTGEARQAHVRLTELAASQSDTHKSLSELAEQVSDGLAQTQRRLAESSEEAVAAIHSLGELNGRFAVVESRLDKAETAQSTLEGSVSNLEQAGGALETHVAELREVLNARLGPEFEERLEAWRVRLDNEISDAVQRGRTEDGLANQERETALRAELKTLHDLLANLGRSAEERQSKLDASLGELRTEFDAQSTGAASREAELGDLVARTVDAKLLAAAGDQVTISLVDQRVGMAVEGLARRSDIDEKVSAAVNALASKSDFSEQVNQALDLAKQAHAATKALAGSVAKSDDLKSLAEDLKATQKGAASSAAAIRKLSDSNATVARPFDRMLSGEMLDRFEQHWLKTFGLNMSRTALAYMAHKICQLEDKGLGRIAAPIETVVMRQLALRSLQSRSKLEVLEIGALFGLSASVLYNFQGARSSGMFLTLMDPLEGYYEAGSIDPVTGIEVSEAVLFKNLEDLDVPRGDYRLIKELSSSPSAIKAASDRLYDYVLIDGDHSTGGVAADFENYGPLVKPGGLIIFDDYGSNHWPGIKPYVDETVRTDPDWIWIGADYRTAVIAKRADAVTAKIVEAEVVKRQAPRRAKPVAAARTRRPSPKSSASKSEG